MKRIGFGAAFVLAAVWVRADAPTGRYVVTTETVRDNQTRLTWQRTIGASSLSWTAATAYCMALALPLDGGGFRVPSAKELQTIVEEGRAGPSIDTTAFPNTPSSRFWSSTPGVNVPNLPNSAWLVSFDDGEVNPGDTSMLAPVRCVR